ncbi:MAG: hypothetical protein JHC70_10790 [Rhodococcus sp.]|nr:hypothetical protein [Rhodococcus sp. (in: high G+C Gram-positive bacteria)]MBJ7322811.1 hypothetical protein [Rhodococcus sp. (in: high G+C Gram-positive bacteria)]
MTDPLDTPPPGRDAPYDHAVDDEFEKRTAEIDSSPGGSSAKFGDLPKFISDWIEEGREGILRVAGVDAFDPEAQSTLREIVVTYRADRILRDAQRDLEPDIEIEILIEPES